MNDLAAYLDNRSGEAKVIRNRSCWTVELQPGASWCTQTFRSTRKRLEDACQDVLTMAKEQFPEA